MNRWHSTLVAIAMALAFVGCHRSGSSAPGDTRSGDGEQRYHLDHAQPTLPTIKLWLGSEELNTEVARRTVEIATGMMFRTNLAETNAMLFVFAKPFRASFYMRNTKVPLTAAYLAPDGTVLELHDLQPLEEKPVTADTDRVQYVLEVPQGWFKRHNLGTGVVVRTPFGSLGEVDWVTLRARLPREP